jgi:hypothetical protein
LKNKLWQFFKKQILISIFFDFAKAVEATENHAFGIFGEKGILLFLPFNTV